MLNIVNMNKDHEFTFKEFKWLIEGWRLLYRKENAFIKVELKSEIEEKITYSNAVNHPKDMFRQNSFKFAGFDHWIHHEKQGKSEKYMLIVFDHRINEFQHMKIL